MGRHSAASGAGTDPIVAAALGRRSGAPAEHGAPAGDGAGDRTPVAEGPLGWPGPEPAPGDGGLGWPGRHDDAATGIDPAGQGDEGPVVQGGAPPVRRGWRRFFGLERAA